MNIVLLGDSITDMDRNREQLTGAFAYGDGYPFFVQGELSTATPQKHTVYNKGISGNRIVDVYARVKADCWNLNPDVVSCLIGINDVWHEIFWDNGVDPERFIRMYEMLLDDTRARFPNVKFIVLEPFVLKGEATAERYEEFLIVKEYAKEIKALAERKGCVFVPLQAEFDRLAAECGDTYWLYDGVHPTVAGSKIIANAWLKAFATIEG